MADIIEALSSLAWPLLIAGVLYKIWPTVLKIIASRGFTIKYGDAELSVQDASDQLRKQVEDLQDLVADMIGKPINEVGVNFINAKSAIGKNLLWVDDKPSNNAHEVSKFQDDGFSVTQVKSTAEALEFIESGNHVDTIISDMGRSESGRYVGDAGLVLIRELREIDISAPIYIYTSRKYAQKHHDQSIEAGGNGATASPVALFKMVENG